jgi:hypothetical protein
MAYEYTLADVYKIFQEAEDKVAQLIEFRDMKLPYNIKWDRIIEINSGKRNGSNIHSQS